MLCNGCAKQIKLSLFLERRERKSFGEMSVEFSFGPFSFYPDVFFGMSGGAAAYLDYIG